MGSCQSCLPRETDQKSNTFLKIDAEAVLKNQLRLPPAGYVQMKPIMLEQTDTVNTSEENTAHQMHT